MVIRCHGVDAVGWEFDTVISVPCKEKFEVNSRNGLNQLRFMDNFSSLVNSSFLGPEIVSKDTCLAMLLNLLLELASIGAGLQGDLLSIRPELVQVLSTITNHNGRHCDCGVMYCTSLRVFGRVQRE
jgi:hypothetical protein